MTLGNYKEQIGAVSSSMARVHKMIFESEMEFHEQLHGIKVNPAGRLQLLLNAPEFAWLRVMSQLMAFVDEVYFQKEPIKPEQITTVKTGVEDLMIKQSESDFSKRYRHLLATVPDLIIEHGRLRQAVMEMKS